MALVDTTWYISSVAYAAVTVRPQNTAVAAGVVRRQFTAPAVGSERCFVCTQAGTTANTTDATWSITRGVSTTDGTVKWYECTGMAAVNGDSINTPTWAALKAIGGNVSVGVIIKRNNGVSYQYCIQTASQGASEPAFSDTAGVTTNDGSIIWTSLGPVGNFPAWGAPHARLANAYATNWGAAGHKFWVADNHAETQVTALTLTSPATAAAGPTYTICVDRTAALPPVEANYNTGATITSTVNSDLTLTAASMGSCYYQGIAFSSGSGSSTASVTIAGVTINYIFKNCTFIQGTTSSASNIKVGAATTPCRVLWDNCTVQFAHISQSVALGDVNFEWRSTTTPIQGAIVPTSLFSYSTTNIASFAVCRGMDFSAYAGTLLLTPNNTTPLVFEDCKFHASVTRYGSVSSIGYAANPLITVRCDS